MDTDTARQIVAELEAIDEHLGWRDEKGTLTESQKPTLYLIQIARPFLKTLVDIAQSLQTIANNSWRERS